MRTPAASATATASGDAESKSPTATVDLEAERERVLEPLVGGDDGRAERHRERGARGGRVSA